MITISKISAYSTSSNNLLTIYDMIPDNKEVKFIEIQQKMVSKKRGGNQDDDIYDTSSEDEHDINDGIESKQDVKDNNNGLHRNEQTSKVQ